MSLASIDRPTKEGRRLQKIKWHTIEEIQKILNIAKQKSYRDYAMLLVGYNHGMRCGELGMLQLEHWDEERHRIFIPREKHGVSNTYKTRDDEQRALRDWVKIRGDAPGPMFVSRQSGLGKRVDPKGISTRMVYKVFRGYAERAGIQLDKVHPHTLRHSCAVHMVDAGIPLIQIKDWLGHNHIQSTEIYAKVSDKMRNETAERFYQEEKERKERGQRVKWSRDRKK